MPSDNYPFAIGRIRIIENSLLDKSKIMRLHELSFQEAVKQLSDWGYAADYPIKTDPDALIDYRRSEVRKLVAEVTPSEKLTDLFYLDIDATNLKLLLKSRLLGGSDIENLELQKGVFDVALLKNVILEKDPSLLGDDLGKSLSEVEERLKLSIEPRLISAMIDNAFYKHIINVVRKSKNEFCEKYFTAKIDFTNVLSVLRARELHWDETDFDPMIIDGGTIERKALLEAVRIDEDRIAKILCAGDNAETIRRVLELNKSGSLELARDRINELLLSLAKEERYDSFGIGPIAYFILASENESRALRVLFAKKRAGLS